MVIRNADARWSSLSVLLTSCEKLLEANCRLDVYERNSATRLHARDEFCSRLDLLETKIDSELSRITVERLLLDLERKREAHARRQAA